MASSARIDELRKKFEENPRRYFAPLANEYRKAGDINQAISICREYLPQQPGHMSGHIVYGQALYEGRQFDEAKTVFETALSLDPENLIALRHLGDISLIVGDSDGARAWYRRVLEADPRNEEIQAHLATLDLAAASAPAPAPAVSSVPTPLPDLTPISIPALPVEPPASSVPTLVVPAIRATPAESRPIVTADTPTAEVDVTALPGRAQPVKPQNVDTPPMEKLAIDVPPPAIVIDQPGPADNAATQALQLDSPVGGAPPASDAAPGSFRMDGLETTSLATETPAESQSLSTAPTVELDLGGQPPPLPHGAAPSTADAPQASAPTTPHDSGATTLAGKTADESAPPLLDLTSFTPPQASRPESAASESSHALAASAPAVAVDTGSVRDPSEPPPIPASHELLDLSMPAPPSGASALPKTVDLEKPALDAVPHPTAEEPVVSKAEAPAPSTDLPLIDFGDTTARPAETPPSAPDSGPFVTETMAELYLKQGHRDEALRVYRALLEQRPGDAALQEKIAGLQPLPLISLEAAPAKVAVGPTIREVLTILAMRRPGVRPEPLSQNGSPSSEAAPQAVTDAGTPAAAAAPPASAGPVSEAPFRADVISALFANAPISAADESAARSLAFAFADTNGGGPRSASGVPGAPARQASDELSLDSVFGSDDSAPRAAPATFSFDQFFSPRASTQADASARASGGGTAAPDDVAHFTKWLEGLKQR